MKVLFVHQNFPGQFKHLAPALQAAGHEVRALGIDGRGLEAVPMGRYKPARGTTRGIHPWAADFETKVIRGEACARAALVWAKEGFRPDVIVAHPGWGESLFLKEIWPQARLLSFLEFYYRSSGLDVGFDPEFPRGGWEGGARLTARNASALLSLEVSDGAYSPTFWQRSTYPAWAQPRIQVIHDGIDTAALCPAVPSGPLVLPDGTRLPPEAEILTFVNRNLEPYRGYHVFMRALPAILARRPQAHVVLVGGDGVSYGAAAPAGTTWKTVFLEEVKDSLDLSRVHFTGKLPYGAYIDLLRRSRVHAYLTYPFVLSWSLLEAMSCGCLVVASRTPPVEEVVTHGENGLLVDFFDVPGWADAIAGALENQAGLAHLRRRARETVVERYDLLSRCLPAQVGLVERLAG